MTAAENRRRLSIIRCDAKPTDSGGLPQLYVSVDALYAAAIRIPARRITRKRRLAT